MLVDIVEGPSDPPLDTMKLAHLEPADMLLRLDAPDGTHRMRVIADAVMTRWDETDVVGARRCRRGARRRHRAGDRAPPRPHHAGAALGAAVGLGELDRRGRHDGRPRHAQPRRVRPRPARHGPRREHGHRVGRRGRGRARGRGARAHRAPDRRDPLAAAGRRGRGRAEERCRTRRWRSGSTPRPSRSRCSR